MARLLGKGAHRARVFAGAALLVASAARDVGAEPATGATLVDRAVVRFYSPEMGGTAEPHFVSQRMLGFEARLEVIADRPDGVGDGYDERTVRAALDHHVSEEVLASLAHKLIAGLQPSLRPQPAELSDLQRELADALAAKLGGTSRVQSAADAEGLVAAEVDDLMQRQALAAWYLDRVVTPLLHPSEDQLREVFRSAAHPYRGQPFEQAKAHLKSWLAIQRLRISESAFLQTARARVHMVIVP